jgi:hypothetical protein
MGGFLFVLMCIIALYYPLRSARKTAEVGARWFRAAHWQLFWFFSAIYAIHSYSMLPLLLWIVWACDYYLHRVPVERLLYVRTKDGRVILLARLGVFSPQGIGVYYQLRAGSGTRRRWASYTAIPIGSRAVMFMIAPSVFSRHLESLISDVNYDMGVQNASISDMEFLRGIVHLKDILHDPETVVWNLERRGRFGGMGAAEIPFGLFGPYHSNNSDVNNHSRCLVITSGIGSTIRDAVVAHQLQKRGAWTKLVCLHMAGRTVSKSPDFETFDELKIALHEESDRLVEHIELRCETSVEFWSKLLCAAIPLSPMSREERQGLTEDEVQERIDERRFVIVVCGRKAAEMVEDAVEFRQASEHLSQEQLQYIDIEEFK